MNRQNYLDSYQFRIVQFCNGFVACEQSGNPIKWFKTWQEALNYMLKYYTSPIDCVIVYK